MARESKRNRDEKRFGKPERLADLISSTPIDRWAFPVAFKFADENHRVNAVRTIESLGRAMARATLVDATNVSEYVYRYTMDEKAFDWESLVVQPSFDEMFIESVSPNHIFKEKNFPANFPKRFGFYIQHGSAEVLLNHFGETVGDKSEAAARAKTGVVLIPVTFNSSSGTPGYLGCSTNLLLDERGTPISRSISSIDKWHHSGGTAEYYHLMQGFMSLMPLYAMRFMNCKNVTTIGVDPERAVNRERRKAGLKPFLRYHTINIEPMKRVLKTEGNIETEGLKKALHICRGHFATYTEDKPLFGHFTGTVWKPAHVRGSAKQGVVVSDYSVNAPKP